MIRRTITLPAELAEAVDRCVEAGDAPNVSRFIQQAVRAHLAAREHARIAEEARRLDPAEEESLIRSDIAAASPPWGRLAGRRDVGSDDAG